MLIGSDTMYLGTAGNTDYPCAPKAIVQLEKRQMSTGALVWHRQLDPASDSAPDSVPLVEIILGILGSLLVLLGLVLFFLLPRSQPKSQALSLLPGDPDRVMLSASMLPRIGGKDGLLLALVGLVLLLMVAGLVAAQGTP